VKVQRIRDNRTLSYEKEEILYGAGEVVVF
jgi:hypothetical protein